MAYLFKQKLRLEELVDVDSIKRRILMFEPDEDLAAVYARYLSFNNFQLRHVPTLFNLQATLFNPELLIFRADIPFPLAGTKNLFRRLMGDFPGLKVITTGYNLSSEDIRELMSSGVVSHMNRRTSRPQDLVLVVKTILTN